jgi:hypothetical protein
VTPTSARVVWRSIPTEPRETPERATRRARE